MLLLFVFWVQYCECIVVSNIYKSENRKSRSIQYNYKPRRHWTRGYISKSQYLYSYRIFYAFTDARPSDMMPATWSEERNDQTLSLLGWGTSSEPESRQDCKTRLERPCETALLNGFRHLGGLFYSYFNLLIRFFQIVCREAFRTHTKSRKYNHWVINKVCDLRDVTPPNPAIAETRAASRLTCKSRSDLDVWPSCP